MTREQLLQKLWGSINSPLDPRNLRTIIRRKHDNNIPFSDTGAAIERILAAGASEHDLQLVMRYAAYQAVFDTLYWIADPGVNKAELDLHESLLSADPSGMEGRPGSADTIGANRAPKPS